MTGAYGRYPAFPFRVGEDGRTACVADPVQHVTEEVVQLILTAVGERLFQPDIGTNVRRLVFESLDEATAGITKSTISQALSRWLGDRAAARGPGRRDGGVDDNRGPALPAGGQLGLPRPATPAHR